MDIRGTANNVGGLVGFGEDADITSSYAARGSVRGLDNVGGLFGFGEDADIISSYAVRVSVSGGDNIGGMVGKGDRITIISSYASGGDVSGIDYVGGLVGYGETTKITSSYAASWSVRGVGNIGGLIGLDVGSTITDSYWDRYTSGIAASSDGGEAKTTEQLQTPIDFAGGIYASWGAHICKDGSRAWNLGGSTHYPKLTCTPDKLTAQDFFAATKLRATPDAESVILIWNNPDAQIASINISYRISGSEVSQNSPVIINSGDQ